MRLIKLSIALWEIHAEPGNMKGGRFGVTQGMVSEFSAGSPLSNNAAVFRLVAVSVDLNTGPGKYLFLPPLMSSDSFASFKQSFNGDISTPTDADYAQAISRWAVNAQVNAEIVAFVRNPEDVALAIAYAKENRLPIAICCGGHSTGGGSSTKGLVIDLSRHLNAVKIDPDNKLAYVGGGALWGQVDKASIQHGLATVAGSVNHVRCTAGFHSIFIF
jgi:hypothetical protein